MNTDKKEEEKKDRRIVPVIPEAELTDKIIGAAFAVHNELGSGFLERVYENAMVIQLRSMGICLEQQKQLQVHFMGVVVGDYQADLVVEGRVLLELKSVSTLDPVHEAQIMNYLRASGIKVGLLLNFGRPKLQFKRFVC